jgi:large conductance mechanosensitive channel
MFKDVKKFILRGNVVDLAVAVLIGAAFNSVVSSLVKDMITPLITAIRGKNTNFSNLYFTFHQSRFLYGDFLNQLISFVIIALVIFYLIVQPITKMRAYADRNRVKEDTERICPQCLSKIPKDAKRCAFCTSVIKKS